MTDLILAGAPFPRRRPGSIRPRYRALLSARWRLAQRPKLGRRPRACALRRDVSADDLAQLALLSGLDHVARGLTWAKREDLMAAIERRAAEQAVDPRQPQGRRLRRMPRLEAFTREQRRDPTHISFERIALHCANERGSIEPDETRRRAAFDALVDWIRDGRFEDERGRSLLLFRHADFAWPSMTRERLADLLAVYHYPPPPEGPVSVLQAELEEFERRQSMTLIEDILPCCWMPVDLWEAFRAEMNLRQLPELERLEAERRRAAPLPVAAPSDVATPPPGEITIPAPGDTMPTPSPRKRGRGRPPIKTEATVAAMRRDAAAGIDVAGMAEKEMAERYGVSRDTCRNAMRRAGLSRE